jgi:hypothetical protein
MTLRQLIDDLLQSHGILIVKSHGMAGKLGGAEVRKVRKGRKEMVRSLWHISHIACE